MQVAPPPAAARRGIGLASTEPGCFLAGTLVRTASGPRPIEEIRAGDLVLARDEHTGAQGLRRVVRLFRGTTDRTVTLRVAPAGPAGRDSRDAAQTLRCTPEHPFWVQGLGWLAAEHLRPGDRLLAHTGKPLVVVHHALALERADHFNFEVEGWHTYFVAGDPTAPAVWVHNTCWNDFQKATKGHCASRAEAAAAYKAVQANKANIPSGIPKNWIAKPSKQGGGVRYVDPNNPHNSIRVMPGDPSSPFPNSQAPYVRMQKSGQALDAAGNVVPKNTPAAHVPAAQLPAIPPGIF